MYLRDIVIFADENIVETFRGGFVSWFHRETCWLTDLYVTLLRRKLKTSDTTKVQFQFTDNRALAPSVKQLLTIAETTWLFDFDTYVHAHECNKKRMLLASLHAALIWLGTQRNWDTQVFEYCRQKALERNLTYRGISNRSWPSPDGKYKARVAFSYGLRSVDFYVVVFDRRGRELGVKALGSAVSGLSVAAYMLKGTGKWGRGNTFRWLIPEFFWELPKAWTVSLADVVG